MDLTEAEDTKKRWQEYWVGLPFPSLRLPCPAPTPGAYSNSNHLILCHPLLLLPSIFPSIRVFSNESVLRLRWPEYYPVPEPANLNDTVKQFGE